jgi:hypothetical protein
MFSCLLVKPNVMTFTRRLVSGTTQLTFSNGVVRLRSSVTMPILTVLLSPQAYGVATLMGTVISLVPRLSLIEVWMEGFIHMVEALIQAGHGMNALLQKTNLEVAA